MLIEDFFKKNDLPLFGKSLVIATSGGPDSMALLSMLNSLQAKYHLRLIAAHLNHQLRLDSEQEALVIRQFCRDKQIKVVDTVWPVEMHPQTGVEAAARDFRYSFLLKVMAFEQADYLLTAHHCDDLLENILLKFIRSGNPNEMNSLPAVSQRQGVTLLRPLIAASKAQLLAYDQTQQVPFIEDTTNAADDVLRNRLRHHVVPLLKRENPQIGTNALRYTEQMSLLTKLAERTFAAIAPPELFLGGAYRQKVDAFSSLSKHEQTLYWQHFIWQTWHIRVNENLPGFNLLNYQQYWYIMPTKLLLQTKPHVVKLEQEFTWGTRKLLVSSDKHANGKLLGQFKANANIQLIAGSLASGAKLLLKNGQHVKSKKKFAQNGIPTLLRPYCLALFANKQVVFVEKTYSNQVAAVNAVQYYVYNINDKIF